MQRMPGTIDTVFHHYRKENMSNKWKPSQLCSHIWAPSLCLPLYAFEVFQASSQTEICWFPPMGRPGSDLCSPQRTCPAHGASFLKVPEIRRYMLYCETFIASGGHRSYVKSTVRYSFLEAFVFSQSSHHMTPQWDSHKVWYLFLSVFEPGCFWVPLLQPGAQRVFSVTSRPGHWKHT